MRRLVIAASFWLTHAAAAAPPGIVAAENVYGEVAAELAGPDAKVTSILSNPAQDPHLFEASPSVARALAGAAIVIANGDGYDPWIDHLLAASPAAHRTTISVAALVHAPTGGNPHLWYDPTTMPQFATALADALCRIDPPHAQDYRHRLAAFQLRLVPLEVHIAILRPRLAGSPVTATEPVFGLMARTLGLAMRNERFQLAVMNDTEPRASDVAAFEDDLRQRRVRALLYNAQVTDASTQRLLGIARAEGIPVIGVTETLPPAQDYVGWMFREIDELAAALGK